MSGRKLGELGEFPEVGLCGQTLAEYSILPFLVLLLFRGPCVSDNCKGLRDVGALVGSGTCGLAVTCRTGQRVGGCRCGRVAASDNLGSCTGCLWSVQRKAAFLVGVLADFIARRRRKKTLEECLNTRAESC